MYADYPWYFETNDVLQSWAYTKGGGSIVDLVDSCVDFSSPLLKDREYGNQSICRKTTDLYFIHGTAMAGLIAAVHGIDIPKNDSKNEFLNIVGLAPEALIKNTMEDHDTQKIEVTKKAFKEALSEKEAPSTKYGKPYIKKVIRPDLILINLSGATKIKVDADIHAIEKTDWLDLIKRMCSNKYSLVIASVGNAGQKLGGMYEYLPATLKSKTCGEFDPIIRVGAITEYKKGEVPSLYYNSNYGSKHVDILAPGGNIPILIPGNKTIIAGGTSEAAAITSATAALLIGCHPKATAQEIKNAILDYSDTFDSLREMANEGKVLNVKDIVSSFCINKKPLIITETGNINTNIKVLTTIFVGVIAIAVAANKYFKYMW